MEQSAPTPYFYDLLGPPGPPPDGAVARFGSTAWTAGPWTADAQHGGPPSALLGRSIERLAADSGGGTVGRISVDLLGPVPVGELAQQVI